MCFQSTLGLVLVFLNSEVTNAAWLDKEVRLRSVIPGGALSGGVNAGEFVAKCQQWVAAGHTPECQLLRLRWHLDLVL